MTAEGSIRSLINPGHLMTPHFETPQSGPQFSPLALRLVSKEPPFFSRKTFSARKNTRPTSVEPLLCPRTWLSARGCQHVVVSGGVCGGMLTTQRQNREQRLSGHTSTRSYPDTPEHPITRDQVGRSGVYSCFLLRALTRLGTNKRIAKQNATAPPFWPRFVRAGL